MTLTLEGIRRRYDRNGDCYIDEAELKVAKDNWEDGKIELSDFQSVLAAKLSHTRLCAEPTKPAPSKPAPAKPAPTKPAPSKPAPTKPAPSKPAPTKKYHNISFVMPINSTTKIDGRTI